MVHGTVSELTLFLLLQTPDMPTQQQTVPKGLVLSMVACDVTEAR